MKMQQEPHLLLIWRHRFCPVEFQGWEKQADRLEPAGFMRAHFHSSFSPIFNPVIIRGDEGAPVVLPGPAPPELPASQKSCDCQLPVRVIRNCVQHKGTERPSCWRIVVLCVVVSPILAPCASKRRFIQLSHMWIIWHGWHLAQHQQMRIYGVFHHEENKLQPVQLGNKMQSVAFLPELSWIIA